MSEAFCRAYTAMGRCRDDTNFKSWLLKITYNCCQDVFRKRKRSGIVATLDDAMNIASLDSPLNAVIDKEAAESLSYALAALSYEERAALVMKYYHNASYQEIGEVLGWAMGTVASRLSRSKAKLSRILGGDNDE